MDCKNHMVLVTPLWRRKYTNMDFWSKGV